MADPTIGQDLYNLFRDHSDIRHDVAKAECDTIGAVKDAQCTTAGSIKDARHDTIHALNTEADRIVAQSDAHFVASQQFAFNTSRDVAALKASTDMGFQKMASDILTQAALGQAATALESAKVAAAIALGQAKLEQTVAADGNATRALINDLKMQELNRALLERNAEIVECRHDRNRYHDGMFQSQFAAVQTQLQAFGSQLQEARQSTVNFGSMTGNAGRNQSTNNVA